MTPEVFAAHLLAALPLAGVIGLRLAGRPLAWAAVGVAAAVGGWAAWVPLAGFFDDLSVGLVARAVVRTGLLVAVAAPWAAAVAGLVRPAVRPRPTWLAAGAAVVAAVALPAVAADRAAAAGLAEASRHLSNGRLAAGDQALDRVLDLTADRTLSLRGRPTTLDAVRAELARQLDTLRAEVERSPPETVAGRYERAEALLALGRPTEVEPLLRDHLAGSPRARLRLAEALADLRNWPGVAEQCRLAAEATREPAATSPKAAAVRRQSLDMLADALAEQDDRPGVEAALRDGADTLPAFAGHFRLRLGDFYRTIGRPLAALAELREAERLDPSLASRVAGLRRVIVEQTPGCLVGR